MTKEEQAEFLEGLAQKAKVQIANYLREHPGWWNLSEEVLHDKLSEIHTDVTVWKEAQRPHKLTKEWARIIHRAELSTDWWLNRIALRYASLDLTVLDDIDRAIVIAVYRMHTHMGITTKCSIRVLNTLVPQLSRGMLARQLKVLSDAGWFEYVPGRPRNIYVDGKRVANPRGGYAGRFALRVNSYEASQTYIESIDDFDWTSIVDPLSEKEISLINHTMSTQRAANLYAVENMDEDQRKFKVSPREYVVSHSHAEKTPETQKMANTSLPDVTNKVAGWTLNQAARRTARWMVDFYFTKPVEDRISIIQRSAVVEECQPQIPAWSELDYVTAMRLVSKRFREEHDEVWHNINR